MSWIPPYLFLSLSLSHFSFVPPSLFSGSLVSLSLSAPSRRTLSARRVNDTEDSAVLRPLHAWTPLTPHQPRRNESSAWHARSRVSPSTAEPLPRACDRVGREHVTSAAFSTIAPLLAVDRVILLIPIHPATGFHAGMKFYAKTEYQTDRARASFLGGGGGGWGWGETKN